MSEFFDSTSNRLSDGVTARAVDVNALRDEIGVGFDKFPSEANTKRGTINFALDTGAAQELVVSLPHAPSAYVNGLEVVTIPAYTGVPLTINVNSLGVKTIKGYDGGTPRSVIVGIPVSFRYSEVTGYFHLM